METLRQLYASAMFNGDPLADDMGGKASRVHDWRNLFQLKRAWPSHFWRRVPPTMKNGINQAACFAAATK